MAFHHASYSSVAKLRLRGVGWIRWEAVVLPRLCPRLCVLICRARFCLSETSVQDIRPTKNEQSNAIILREVPHLEARRG